MEDIQEYLLYMHIYIYIYIAQISILICALLARGNLEANICQQTTHINDRQHYSTTPALQNYIRTLVHNLNIQLI